MRSEIPRVRLTHLQQLEAESIHIIREVVAEILGVPQEDRRLIVDMGDRILGNQHPEVVCKGIHYTRPNATAGRTARDHERVHP